MAKIHPRALVASTHPSYFTSRQETFTIWMKSLVLNGKGCTVFDSNGHVVYRVDNYNYKCSNRVYLMDFKGNALFTILRKKLKLFSCWEGYKSLDAKIDKAKPSFQVKKTFSLLKRGLACKVIVGLDKSQPSAQYKIESSWTGKSTCKIADMSGVLVAEVKRKQLASGLALGEDVLTMVVEPRMDHSLIMGLFLVYNIINCRI